MGKKKFMVKRICLRLGGEEDRLIRKGIMKWINRVN